MTPAEFKAARLSMGFTRQADIAPLLGLGSQTRVSEIENSETVPKQAALLMEALLSGWRPSGPEQSPAKPRKRQPKN